MTSLVPETARLDRVRAFRLPKAGEADADCQDFFCFDRQRRRYAVADGVTQSTMPGEWAQLLVERACADGLPTEGGVDDWVAPLRVLWRGMWRNVVERHPDRFWLHSDPNPVGAATLSVLELTPDGRFRLFAIGDTCVFQVRADGTHLSLPLQDPDAFDTRPDCLTTDDSSAGGWLSLHGSYRTGDRFFLASDALAKWILAELRASRPPWRTLLEVHDEPALAALVARELSAGRLALDDIALLIVETHHGTEALAFPARRQEGSSTLNSESGHRPAAAPHPRHEPPVTVSEMPPPTTPSLLRHVVATAVVSLVVSLIGTTVALKMLLPPNILSEAQQGGSITGTSGTRMASVVPPASPSAPPTPALQNPLPAPDSNTASVGATSTTGANRNFAGTDTSDTNQKTSTTPVYKVAANQAETPDRTNKIASHGAVNAKQKTTGKAAAVRANTNIPSGSSTPAQVAPPTSAMPPVDAESARTNAAPATVNTPSDPAPTTATAPTQPDMPLQETNDSVWVQCKPCNLNGEYLIILSATPFNSTADSSRTPVGLLTAGHYLVVTDRAADGWVQIQRKPRP